VLEQHASYCIGETPWVLHNRRAGMVVYLSDEEYEAMINNNLAIAAGSEETFPSEMATNIANRALFGLHDWEAPEGDTESWKAPPGYSVSIDSND
jgi:hypothetical protein